MNLPYFISKRVSSFENIGFSATIHRIAVASIGLGLAIMIISFLILTGFQKTVTEKIYSFSSHLTVTKFSFGSSFDEPPMSINTAIYNKYDSIPGIDHVQEYAHKAGLIKTEEEVLGIVFKGLGSSFDTSRIENFILEGRFIHFTDSTYASEIVLSKTIASKLKVKLNDKILVHFFQNPPRSRRLTVVGIYETNLSEYYDEKVILGDIDLIRRLNDWTDNMVGGLEVFVDNIEKLDETEDLLLSLAEHDMAIERTDEKYLQVFEWLELIKRQVNIFLGIILLVVSVNMISIVIILIMERTSMIGTLKAMGASNKLIRKIFSYSGMQLIFKGLLLGNGIGLILCFMQEKFRIIPLNPHDYYMSYVPIGWNWEIILYLNLLTFVTVMVVLFLPTMIISGIRPIRAIRFD